MVHPAITTAAPADRLAAARAVRAVTTPAEQADITAAEREVDALQYALRLAEVRLAATYRLSTYTLQQTAAEDRPMTPGPQREALALLQFPALDSIARRQRALSIAHTGQNLGIWGRWSDAVHYAAQDLARMIADGREDTEHHVEQVARRDREQQADARAVQTLRLQAEHGLI